MLFEAMAGRLPFDGPSNAAIAGQKLSQTPAQLGRAVPDVPPVLESFVGRGLSREPSERPDARAFEQALTTSAPVRGEAVPPTGTALAAGAVKRPTQPLHQTSGGGWGRRRRGAWVLTGLAGAGLV